MTIPPLAYLDTAAEGLPPQPVHDALNEYWRQKSSGSPGRLRHYAVQSEAEQAVATLLSASPADVVLLSNTSDALNLLAASIDWRPGDEVLVYDLEFPSNVLVWLRLASRGVQLTVVPTQNGVTALQDWTSRITPKTRLVSVSQVSYKSGTQIPFLPQLSQAAHAAGALFCVDATQALGRVPVQIEGVDFLVASSYKWLLATHGLAVTYIAPSLRHSLPVPTAGWYSVDNLFHPHRFSSYSPKPTAGAWQAGMPNFPAIYALNASVRYLLNTGIETIDNACKPLIAELLHGLTAQGRPLLTPPHPEFASGIVSFASPNPAGLAAALAAQGIHVWGGDGRVRISVHLYNTAEHIQACLHALSHLPA
jgi:selenocysteine lyase/cysteine desulfurase